MATKRTVSLVIEYKNGQLVTRELNQTADAVERTGTAAERTEKSMLAAKAAAAAVGAALLAAVKYSISEWIKQEDAIAQVEAALRAVGQYTPQLSSKFQALASELQRTSRYGDDQLLPMFTKLITLGNVSADSMERVMRAAMDFAVVTGSLESAVDLLAKASVGYTATLSRYGIIIDEAIPKHEKFEAVLQLIESRMGGMEQQMTQTTSGAIAQLKNAVSDLAETFGQKLVPAIQGATLRLRTFLEAAQASGYAEPGLSGPAMNGANPVNVATGQTLAQMQGAQLLNLSRVARIPRPIGGDMGMPGVNIPFPAAPKLDMSNPPGAGAGDAFSNRMAFFENQWAQAFDGANSGMQQMAGIAQSSASIIGSAFAGAFAGMASGAQSAGDAILGAMLGALGTIATMWGSFLVSVGLGMSVVPGMQAGAAAVGYGAALLALGGTLQGLAASMGTSSNSGGSGVSAGRSGGGAAISVGGGMGGPGGGQTIIVISADGRASSGGTDVGRALSSAGVSRNAFRTYQKISEEANRTSGSY